MVRHLLILPAALLCLAAAPPARAPAQKAPAKAPASRAPAAAPAPWDAQNPQSLIGLLGLMGAKATVGEKADDLVNLRVTTPAGDFRALYAGCDAQGRRCKALTFDAASDQKSVTLAEINAFNQTSLTCRALQAKQDGRPHVLYSTLVFAADARAEMEQNLGAWQGCLAEFGDFLKDPKAYLASAP